MDDVFLFNFKGFDLLVLALGVFVLGVYVHTCIIMEPCLLKTKHRELKEKGDRIRGGSRISERGFKSFKWGSFSKFYLIVLIFSHEIEKKNDHRGCKSVQPPEPPLNLALRIEYKTG